MPKRLVRPLGGILRDQPKFYLPDGVISDGVNVRVKDDSLTPSPGHQSVYGTPQVSPLFVMPVVRSATDHFWLYAGENKAYAVDESDNHTDITNTGGDYSATPDLGWNGGVFGTIPVLNNGADVPQQWASVSTATPLTDLSNWESDIAAGATCRVLRPFQQYLIALNTNEGGTGFPQRVRWSDAGAAGVLPTWDATDPAQDAGFNDLLDSYGQLIDGLALRDRFVIYKENETYLMAHLGGSAVFGFRLIFKTSGALGAHCAVEYRGRHYVFTQGDCVVHDGNTVESIIDRKNREWLFSQVDAVTYDRSFVALNEEAEEIWFCFPENGESFATRALIYSVQNGTWGDRDLPGVRHIGLGEVSQITDTSWDDDSESWDSDDSRWDETEYSPAEQRLVMASTVDTALYEVGNFNTADGTAIRVNAARESDAFGDSDQNIRILRVRPILEASPDTVFTIRIGTQQKIGDPIDFTEYTFTYGTDEQVSVRKTGKFISWEVETEADVFWNLHGIEFEYQGMGYR